MSGSDHLNPVLVKEVRQALRGRYFTFVFWLMLAVATVVGSILLVLQDESGSDDGGVLFFMSMYGCLVGAVNVFVPFHAFLALGSEWEENAYDLLVLTNLRPRQIVLGKLCSALVQTGLFYAAFAPFIVFAFLLRGLDLSAVLYALGFGLLTSTCLSTVALACSAMTTHRFFRVVVMVLLAGGLVQATVVTIVAWANTLYASAGVLGPVFVQALAVFGTVLVTMGAFAFAFACTRLSHREENRSSSLRILTTVAVVVATVWASFLGGVVHPPAEGVVAFFLMVLAGVLATSIFYVTEEERLGRRVRLDVPRNPLLAALASPWLPGGGRGFLFLLVHVALVIAGCAVVWTVLGFGPPLRSDLAVGSAVAAACYALVYLGIPSFLGSFASARMGTRIAARIGVPAFAFLLVFLPMLAGIALDVPWLLSADHAGNVWYTFNELFGGHSKGPLLVSPVLVAGAALALAANLPRAVRGGCEVLAAARARRASRARSAGGALAVAEERGAVTR